MMSEECVAPWCRGRGNAKEAEIVGVFVQHPFAIYKVTQEVVREAAAKDLFVAFGRA
jgi:hypothetical protein